MSKSADGQEVYGIVGVGAIAVAIVTGLMRQHVSPKILLSPRGAQTSTDLATRFDNVEICLNNQVVVDRSDVLLVCVRPSYAETVLQPLSFHPRQTVISAVAGLRLARLTQLVEPALACRAIPLPALARGEGSTPIYPPNAAARFLFEQLGGIAEITSEACFDAFSAASGTIAAHLAYLDTVAGWLAANGIERAAADQYVAATFGGLDLMTRDAETLGDLAREHATPGGINEAFADELATAGVSDAVRAGWTMFSSGSAPLIDRRTVARGYSPFTARL